MVHRARLLGDRYHESKQLIDFYARLISAQKEIYDHLQSRRAWRPSGDLELDLSVLRPLMNKFLSVVESSGPDLLRENAQALKKAEEPDIDGILMDQWLHPIDVQFFPKAFLQPYAKLLSDLNIKPSGRALGAGENRCTFCDGKPQVAYLKSQENEGGGRYLVCSCCLSSWLFRRLVCPNCGEEDPKRLGYYSSPTYEHVRIETCDACTSYIKCIDLTKSGVAVPLVDEVATAALDLWARDNGYGKIELNLVGI